MISTLEKEITFRFLKARKKDGFLNVISIFSFIGISLGVAVLIIVMSVMNGFRTELINKIVGFNSHVTVKPYSNSIDETKINKNNKLKSISKNIIFSNSGEAIILKNKNTKGIVLRGYKQNDLSNLEVLTNEKFKGDLSLFDENLISIGSELSFSLNLEIGDELTLMSPSGVQTIIGSMPKQKTFIVNSIFNSGLAEFDNNIAFIELNVLEEFFGYDPNERNLEIYLKNPNNIESQKLIVKQVFDDEFVISWADMNSSLFSALKVERNVMFIILSLIIIVAAFNIISGLTILVKNKTRDIAILKSIGVLNKSIIKIFFLVGVIIGTSATIFGIFLGVTFSIYIENFRNFLSSVFNISLFPEEIYFLSKMPSEINPTSIILISVCSIIITILVSIFPAFKAARLDPIKSLKYE
ncbi:lipoprotein-releasing ABC transporter permease subunit [Candidatus Pelagibacter sp. HIMB1782]|uniref:lipoprotein-releasing ABC transporter permease subunit n=1 Tax=Candidatus Pelagibacter sp. HIMB1782 TaxID=3413375 RepID=UPI003F87C90B